MTRQPKPRIPPLVMQSLRKFGADIRVARVKRALTSDMMADALGIHRSTYSKVEAGDSMVGLGVYVNALFVLGFGTPLDDIVDPRRDETGMLLDLQRLPKRVRTRKGHISPFLLASSSRDSHSDMTDKVIRVGVVGAMSGPYALWGLVSKHAAQTTANLYNETGGVEIGGERYRVQIVSVDDRLDPETSVSAIKHLTLREGIHYIIGPNVEQTMACVAPIAEKSSTMLFPYSFTRSYYSPPFRNTVLSQVAGYQAWPLIYKYLRDTRRLRTVGIFAPNSPEGLMQRREAVAAAVKLGLEVVPSDECYDLGIGDFGSSLARVVSEKPDMLVLPNLAPINAPKLIKAARDLGFVGLFATEAAQDLHTLNHGAGDAANGLIMLGGASTPEIRSSYMEAFIEHYRDLAGGWNDEAGTKAYALEFVLGTLRQAGKEAITNIDLFKKAIPKFSMKDPFVKGDSTLRYVGSGYFRQRRQIGLPLVVKVVNDGRLETLLVGSVE